MSSDLCLREAKKSRCVVVEDIASLLRGQERCFFK
jgi:hypothetical protein